MPLRRVIPTPVVTRALVGINAAVFVAMVRAGISPTQPNSAELLKWGANWGPYSLGDQPWRLLTLNYLHIGIYSHCPEQMALVGPGPASSSSLAAGLCC